MKIRVVRHDETGAVERHPTTMIWQATAKLDAFLTPLLDRLRSPLLLLVRLVWGYMFLHTGFGKLGNLSGTTEFFASLGLPLPFLNALMVGLLEATGGILLLAGFCSRPIAFLLAGNMLVAYLTAHRDAFANVDSFTAAAPYHFLAAALLVAAFGPGAIAIDELLRRRRVATGNEVMSRAAA